MAPNQPVHEAKQSTASVASTKNDEVSMDLPQNEVSLTTTFSYFLRFLRFFSSFKLRLFNMNRQNCQI